MRSRSRYADWVLSRIRFSTCPNRDAAEVGVAGGSPRARPRGSADLAKWALAGLLLGSSCDLTELPLATGEQSMGNSSGATVVPPQFPQGPMALEARLPCPVCPTAQPKGTDTAVSDPGEGALSADAPSPATPSTDAVMSTSPNAEEVDVPPGLKNVILISIDGLASRFLEDMMRLGRLPAFARLESEGAYTHNARTEARITVTVPNHVSMVTGRPAVPAFELPLDAPHGVVYNTDPGGDITIHDSNPDLAYVASVFDEVHDRGGHTALFAGKSKFALFDRSYSEPHSRADVIGEDDGRNKIDDFAVLYELEELVPSFLEAIAEGVLSRPSGRNFAMLHYANTDAQGHAYGWGSPEYLDALLQADAMLGEILSFVTSTPQLSDTVVIVTADHGGIDFGHSDSTDVNVYRIPFIVWGAGMPAGTDLYSQCESNRQDPGDAAPTELPTPGPIRNGDAANLALSLLGIDEIEGAMHRAMFGSLPTACPPADAGPARDAGSQPDTPMTAGDASDAPADAANDALDEDAQVSPPPEADASLPDASL